MTNPDLDAVIASTDLSIAYSPILPDVVYQSSSRPISEIPTTACIPRKVAKLRSGKYVIYGVDGEHSPILGIYEGFQDINDYWNVSEEFIKEARAKYLLQKAVSWKDLILEANRPSVFNGFRHWNGKILVASSRSQPLYVKDFVLHHFFPEGCFVPRGAENPLVKYVVENYALKFS